MKVSINLPNLLLALFIFTIMAATNAQNRKSDLNITKSEIRQTNEGYRIFLNGEPFYVLGAGVDNGSLESLAAHGANSFRTWSMQNAEEVLDQAHALGLKVMMGIWVAHERHGFNYNDKSAVRKQYDRIRKRVQQLKDHPALMIWGVGNEVNLQSENPKVWDAVNDIARMIHKVDPNHLTTTSLSGLDKKEVDIIAERAPEIDFISAQVYGAIEILPDMIAKSTYKGPLLITEWGATGYWEVGTTEWGAPIENNSSVKADFYLSRYQKSIASQAQQVMGSFVFLWGQKQERTPTWFGMFMPDGKETESVDAMHYVWNGEWPDNRTPRLHDFTLEGKYAESNIKLKAGSSYQARVEVTDPDGDQLSYHWEIMRESQSTATGGDKERIPTTIKGSFPEGTSSISIFTAPKGPGAYRLFITVEDGKNHAAHANIPFWVEK